MSDLESPIALALARLERLVTLAVTGAHDRKQLASLSERMALVRRAAGDGLNAESVDRIFGEMEAIARSYDELAERLGLARASGLPDSPEGFRLYAEAAEIHFRHLAGRHAEHYRAGLLGEYRASQEPAEVARRIALDIVTSPSAAIAASKVHLVRAAISLEDSGERRTLLLGLVREAVLDYLARPAWNAAGRTPALTPEAFEREGSFSSIAAERRLELPAEVRETNAMLPNRPLAGWEEQNQAAVRGLLDDLSHAGVLFTDRLTAGSGPKRVALKIELNMGIEGPPSVTDPAATGAVLFELLERAWQRGVPLHFTVGDSCGVENAPVGRTSMDILRDTGQLHHAVKAALRFVLKRDPQQARRAQASQALERLGALEAAGAFLGSAADRVHSERDVAGFEELAAPWVRCVDYDEAGFTPVRTEPSTLAMAVWGTRDFHIARPWVEADYRVHVTRGCSTHLFAGWTGALKGLIGLHALGLRPADQGMNELGQRPLDLLTGMMHLSGFEAVIGRRSGLGDLAALGARDAEAQDWLARSAAKWRRLGAALGLLEGWKHWLRETILIEAELRRQSREEVPETAIMARLRRESRRILLEAEQRSPGFRDALWDSVFEGTRSGLLTAWKFRSLIPETMRDERMGMRIGLLARAPMQADLVVQSLPKIGIGGGPDAYRTVWDTGVVVAGTDEVTVDLVALRAAGVNGNPWAYNHPIHGAIQFGRGPVLWDEIRMASS